MSVVNSDSVRAGASGVIAGYTIDNSCVFDGAADYLTFTPSTPTDNNTWTFSCWLKIANHDSDNILNMLDSTSSDSVQHYVRIQSQTVRMIQYDSGYEMRLRSAAYLRDAAAWYHIVFVMDTSNGTSGDRTRMYINGVRQTVFITESQPSLNETSFINTASRGMAIGRNAYASGAEIGYMNGYLAEVVFIDGLALTASSFGETDDNGVWVPIDPSTLTFGANGFHLDFADSSALGNDVSGNNNDWTPSGLVAANQTTDSPTDSGTTIGNYATWNPLHRGTTFVATLSEGNKKLDYTGTPGSNNSSGLTTIPFQATGKFYAEILVDTDSSGRTFLGTVNVTTINDGNSQFYAGNSATSQGFYSRANPGAHTYDADDGKVYTGDDAGTTYGDTWTAGDIIGIYWNQGNVWFTKNETLQNSASEAEVVANTTTNAAFTGLSDEFITAGHASDFTLRTDPADWSYTPFSGFLPLCTANLAASSVPDGTLQYFTNTFTGDGTETAITVGGTSSFQPGMVHVKQHDAGGNWGWVDEVRGATNTLVTNSVTDDQIAIAQGVKSFDSGGVTLGTDAEFTGNTDKFMVNFFKGSASSGSTLDAGSQDATVSVNDTAGWSFGVYEGTGSNLTFAHGLSAAPEFIMIKNIDANSTKYIMFHNNSDASAPEDYYLTFGSSIVRTDDATAWQDTAPSSSLVTIGTLGDVNTSGNTHWFWACRSVAGFSKMGFYTGNASTSGPVSYLGFKPAFVWGKISDSTNAGDANMTMVGVHDYNPSGNVYWGHPDLYHQESTRYDLGANFFRPIIAGNAVNRSGSRYVYLSFAQHPFGGSGVAQARGF